MMVPIGSITASRARVGEPDRISASADLRWRSRARVGEPPELGNGFQSSTYGAPARAWVNLDNADLRSMLYASRARVGEPA